LHEKSDLPNNEQMRKKKNPNFKLITGSLTKQALRFQSQRVYLCQEKSRDESQEKDGQEEPLISED
jgi:hypothetical protein